MKLLWVFLSFCTVLTCAFINTGKGTGTDNAIQHYKSGSLLFGQASNKLKAAIDDINPSDSLSVEQAKLALAECRLPYKRIEFFLEHFIPVTARPFNLAPVYEVEEPYMEYQQPRGMQLIESILFSDEIAADLTVLKENAALVNTYANDLHAMIYGIEITDEQVLESLRMELLRIITMHITGFDAPELKSGIREAYESMLSLEYVIQPYVQQASSERTQQLKQSISACLLLLKANPDFNSFNRLQFLTEAALPLQQQLNLLYADLFPQSTYQSPFNLKASSVFSANALSVFNTDTGNALYITQLGKALFFEKQLSGNSTRSCASCHNPDQYFTDGLPKSAAFNSGFVERNSPTLLYASMQHGLFWDARAKSTGEQIM
ncbi:MAG: cytochrome c peroxidase, partial [Bacteroidota bacterium]